MSFARAKNHKFTLKKLSLVHTVALRLLASSCCYGDPYDKRMGWRCVAQHNCVNKSLARCKRRQSFPLWKRKSNVMQHKSFANFYVASLRMISTR
uniref:Putative secreted protein n=1 Tax=Ixodes ricinus TaxID=34613 RepID=A0A6B0U5W4_IXORI